MPEQVTQAMVPASDDAALLASVAAGDQTAMARLYDRFAGLVHAVALRMFKDRGAAEELTADVFVEAWRRAGNYAAERGSVATWLATITRSRGIDRIRARQRRSLAPLDQADTAAASAAPEAGRELLASDDRTRIAAGLAALDAQQRAAIELAYFAGMSHVEVAARLGRPLGTVKTHIRQGLIQLRQALRTDGQGGA